MNNFNKTTNFSPTAQQSKLKSKWLLSFCLIYFLSFYSTTLLAQPPNDNLVNAIEVFNSDLPYTHNISDVESNAATEEDSEVHCTLGFESWWYSFTVITGGDFNISAICTACTGGNGDLDIGIFQGSNHPLTQVYCQDFDNENSLGESTTQTLAVGSYFLKVTSALSRTLDNPPITTTISSVGGVLSENTGSAASIPTLSEWGLIILALSFMTLGTLYLVQPKFRGGIFEQER